MKAAAFMLAPLLLAGCASRTPRQPAAIDQGYLLGAADTVKQLYWAKQALEEASSAPAGRIEYYRWEDSGAVSDGRRLAPETVCVPVFVAAPAPAGGGP